MVNMWLTLIDHENKWLVVVRIQICILHSRLLLLSNPFSFLVQQLDLHIRIWKQNKNRLIFFNIANLWGTFFTLNNFQCFLFTRFSLVCFLIWLRIWIFCPRSVHCINFFCITILQHYHHSRGLQIITTLIARL